ncbi:hypothetical protein Mal15_20220 [Stieleria maiorica]|uniref:Uncharacterized protein n=1 Tax=Stieleria maiorica TaxID=2795974 RepID=A0A5B9MCM3_9BACT|nr:hypothetical protein Mal15_20220 [Stieleria maiorica]
MKNDAQYKSQPVNVIRVSVAPSKCEPSAMQSTKASSWATTSMLSALFRIVIELGMVISRGTINDWWSDQGDRAKSTVGPWSTARHPMAGRGGVAVKNWAFAFGGSGSAAPGLGGR